MILPKISRAYTGRCLAKESKFNTQNATPAPIPCSRTNGVCGESVFSDIVHILSESETVGPISTYQPRYGVFRTIL